VEASVMRGRGGMNWKKESRRGAFSAAGTS
jgi:hypothetical protein